MICVRAGAVGRARARPIGKVNVVDGGVVNGGPKCRRWILLGGKQKVRIRAGGWWIFNDIGGKEVRIDGVGGSAGRYV